MPVKCRRNYPDQVPDNLLCPICMEVPESKVLQCKRGHVLCANCHDVYSVCPSCQQPLDKKKPIRCLHFENTLDDFQFSCSFKSNGCNQSFTRTLLSNHESVCCFDFKKFGKFGNLCKLLGYSKCEFQLNNGNTKEALEHFRTHHEFNLVNGKDPFEIEFDGLQKANSKNKSLWTPTIIELKTCSVLILPFLTKEEIRLHTIALPSPDKICPIKVEYSLGNASTKYTFVQIPNTLENTCAELQKVEGFSFRIQLLKQFNKKDLKITCNVKEGQPPQLNEAIKIVVCKLENNALIDTEERHEPVSESNNKKTLFVPILVLVCAIAVAVIFIGITKEHAMFGNWNELKIQTFQEKKSFVDKLDGYLAKDRNLALSVLKKIFEKEKPKGVSYLMMKDLKIASIEMAVKYGTMDALDYVIKNKLHLEHEHLHDWIYWTLAESDHALGVEKAKALVNAGVSTKFMGEDGKNLLHAAVEKSNEEILKYLLKDVGVEVNQIDFNGKTPLHYAVDVEDEYWAVKSSTLLLKHGANALAKDEYGWTPAYKASHFKYKRVKVYQVFSKYDEV